MAISHIGELDIQYLDRQGLGNGSDDNQNVKLAFTLPGETVTYQTHLYRGKSNSIALDIKIESDYRAKPPCKYFTHCGGCMLQHMKPEFYQNFKQNNLIDQLSKEGIKANINDMFIIKDGNRRRAKLYLVKKKEQIFLGFYQQGSNKIVNIGHCLMLTKELNKIILPLKELCGKILPERAKIEIYLMQVDNGIDILLDMAKPFHISPDHKNICHIFAEENNILRLNTRIEGEDNIVYCRQIPQIKYDQTLVKTEADCFLQTSFVAEKYIQQFVLDNTETKVKIKIADLFCGRGALSLPLADIHDIDGFEIEQIAVDALNEACKENEKYKVTKRDLFNDPLPRDVIDNYDMVIINPPRLGALYQIKEIAESDIRKIIYISCNTQTFIRDCKILIEKGYKIDILQPLDQFYWNTHLEILAYITR